MFSLEFSKAGGFAWLEQEFAGMASAEEHEGYLTIISNAAPLAETFSYLREWVTFAKEILVRLPSKKGAGFKGLAKQFGDILQEQTRCWLHVSKPTDLDVPR